MSKKIDSLAVVSVAAAAAYTVLAVVSVVTDRGAYDIASNLIVAVVFLALAVVQLKRTTRCTAEAQAEQDAQRKNTPSEDGL